MPMPIIRPGHGTKGVPIKSTRAAAAIETKRVLVPVDLETASLREQRRPAEVVQHKEVKAYERFSQRGLLRNQKQWEPNFNKPRMMFMPPFGGGFEGRMGL